MESNLTWEEAVSTFLAAESDSSDSIWTQAEIALGVEEAFGHDDPVARTKALKRFGSEVRYSASTLRKYARTARFFPSGTRIPDLPFTMHRIAANHCPSAELAQTALGKAAEAEWSTRDFQAWCMQQFGLCLTGTLHDVGERGLLLDNEELLELLRRFTGLRVRLQVKVMPEEEG